jgi:uncharacterized membrane protein YhaH (DUF805 family)
MSLLHLLFGFSGRINRGKYWLAVVLCAGHALTRSCDGR